MTSNICVFCDAQAFRDMEGEIEFWGVPWGRNGVEEHEHETINGET